MTPKQKSIRRAYFSGKKVSVKHGASEAYRTRLVVDPRKVKRAYRKSGYRVNPRRRPARNVTEAMRNLGRRALAVGAAGHFIQVRRGAKWVSLCAFFDKATALDYGKALKRKYPRAVLRYFHPDGKPFRKNPAEGSGKLYVGVKGNNRFIFRSTETPTQSSHGDIANAVIGPFRTKRAAELAVAPHGPQMQQVSDFERAAKREKKNSVEGGSRGNAFPRARNNPAPRELSQDAEQAARRLEAFTGHEARRMKTVKVPTAKAALEVGPCLLIGYETTRDGKRENYVHRFASHARPLLAASSDGRTLFLLGGAYRFTDRGITDAR